MTEVKKETMRILGFLRDSSQAEMSASEYYRTYLPLRELHKHDNGITAQCVTKEDLQQDRVTDEQLGGRDIYCMSRSYSLDDSQGYMDAVHAAGGVFVFDVDDDLTEIHRLVSGRGHEFCEWLGIVDYVTCTTHELANHLSQFTQRPPKVLHNYVDVEWMQSIAAKQDRVIEGEVVMGFSGSRTHYIDWYNAVLPFNRLLKENKRITAYLQGDLPDYMEHIEVNDYDEEPPVSAWPYLNIRVFRGSKLPYAMYPQVLSQFDVLLCAVNSSDGFNCGKSWVKALECMALGVVPICSRFTPYLQLETAGAPVVMVGEDSWDGWYEAMRDLVDDDERRQMLSIDGPAWCYEHADMVRGAYLEWESYYRSICES